MGSCSSKSEAAVIGSATRTAAHEEALNGAAASAHKPDGPYTRTVITDIPVTNQHPDLHTEPLPNVDAISKWVLMLPAEAVKQFKLEPNFACELGSKDLWCGRMWHYRRIKWLQYCAARKWSVDVPAERKVEFQVNFAAGSAKDALLRRLQAAVRAWFVHYRGRPQFLEGLIGCNIRSILIYMHGSGGLVWANPRLMRNACGLGCVVLAPDHMAYSDADIAMIGGKGFRRRELRPLHTAEDETGYWENSLFYSGKKEGIGENIEFSTSARAVCDDPAYYKDLYEKVFQVR